MSFRTLPQSAAVGAELIEKRDINAIAKQYTMADALFNASFLNACLRHCEDVGMANIAPIVNNRGPLYVHPNGIVRRTTVHRLAMYANQLEGRVGHCELEAGYLSMARVSSSMIDAVVTVDESGKRWALVLVNRRPAEHVTCTVRMKDARSEKR